MTKFTQASRIYTGLAVSRICFRVAALLVLLCALVFFTGRTFLKHPAEMVPDVIANIWSPPVKVGNLYGYNTGIWKKLQQKYSHLADDKFTIAMLTYKRPKELNATLTMLLGERIPSLEEIVVIWGDIESTPPNNFTSALGVPVRYRHATFDSLNEKLLPDPAYKTQAILLTDDDVYYHPDDLEFVFQSWRKFGKGRLTGALARCAVPDKRGRWQYTFCSDDEEKENNYAMILTNLCFSHIGFMDYYSSNETSMINIRKYVDDHFNCEDIAMNYVQANLTRQGPLLVKGHDNYFNSHPSVGISNRPGHLKARSQCVEDFAHMFQYMPLINETAHIQRGVTINEDF